ncbi:ABC transporter substrate-binding protein [Acidimangrovimonas sediminis]|uniref:ABC transporter substrate-binding protein n=1 Tax=Acidimangrovimonas sediminis TaxID=2056283 RepID=UPI000C80347F|nr:ABC transporter substrate-binding protein [Acidimangrovimonas sediminis]
MTMTNRRALLAGLGAATAAPFVLPRRALAASDTIRVGILSLTSHAPALIAAAKGYFKEQGFEVKLVMFQAAQPMAVAIASGDIDFGMTAISGGLVSLAQKGAIRIIGGALQEHEGIEGQKILASKKAHDAGLKTPADLKGHSFGLTTAGSSFNYMADMIAKKSGFPASDMRLVPLQKVPAIIASLKSGQIDAWSIVPNIADALTKGPEVVEIGKISDYIPDYQVTTVFTSARIADTKPEIAKRYIAALSKGIDDYNNALVYKKADQAEVDAITKIIHQYVYSDQPLEKAAPRIQHGAMLCNPGAALTMSSVKSQLEWLQGANMAPKDVTLDQLVKTGYVKTL